MRPSRASLAACAFAAVFASSAGARADICAIDEAVYIHSDGASVTVERVGSGTAQTDRGEQPFIALSITNEEGEHTVVAGQMRTGFYANDGLEESYPPIRWAERLPNAVGSFRLLDGHDNVAAGSWNFARCDGGAEDEEAGGEGG